MGVKPKSNFLKIVKLFSSTIGIFPSEFLFSKNKFAQSCYSIYSKLTFGYFVSFAITMYLELFTIVTQNEVNVAELSKNLSITPIFTITFIRQTLMFTPVFKGLIKFILDGEDHIDFIDDEMLMALNIECATSFNRNIKVYLSMMVVTEFCYTSRPMFEPEIEIFVNNETFLTKQLPLATWFPFDKQQHFTAAYLIQVVDIIFGSCFDTYGEFILVAVVAYPACQLKLLRYTLVNFEIYCQKLSKVYGLQRDDLAAFVTLRRCILWHRSIIKYVEDFNSIMSMCMFLDFIQSSFHMACVLSETLTKPVIFAQLISVVPYIIIMVFRLFLYYYYANEVIVLSQDLAPVLYQSNWYEQSRRFKFMTLMMIMRSQKPLKYRLAGFGDMSLSTFLSILNAAYSYIMLMCNVK